MERAEIIAIVAEEMERMVAEDPSRFQGPPGVDGGYLVPPEPAPALRGPSGYPGEPGSMGKPGVCHCLLCGIGRFLRRLI